MNEITVAYASINSTLAGQKGIKEDLSVITA